jgi:hypothetical protein
VCPTSISPATKKLLQLWAESLGSGFNTTFTREVTHLVAAKAIHSDKYRAAVKLGKPIVTHEWIEQSFRAGRVLPTDEFRVPCLMGAVITAVGLDATAEERVRKLTSEHGGNYASVGATLSILSPPPEDLSDVHSSIYAQIFQHSVTHIICALYPVPAALSALAKEHKVPIVSPAWLEEITRTQGQVFKESDFEPRDPELERKESEEQEAKEKEERERKLQAQREREAEDERRQKAAADAASVVSRYVPSSSAAAALLPRIEVPEAKETGDVKMDGADDAETDSAMAHDTLNDDYLSGYTVILFQWESQSQYDDCVRLIRNGGGTRLMALAGREDLLSAAAAGGNGAGALSSAAGASNDGVANVNVSSLVLLVGAGCSRGSLEASLVAQCGRGRSLASIGIPVVTHKWLWECNKEKRAVPVGKFLYNVSAAWQPDTPPAAVAATTPAAAAATGRVSPFGFAGGAATTNILTRNNSSVSRVSRLDATARPTAPLMTRTASAVAKQQTTPAANQANDEENELTALQPNSAAGGAGGTKELGPSDFSFFAQRLAAEKAGANSTAAAAVTRSSSNARPPLPPTPGAATMAPAVISPAAPATGAKDVGKRMNLFSGLRFVLEDADPDREPSSESELDALLSPLRFTDLHRRTVRKMLRDFGASEEMVHDVGDSILRSVAVKASIDYVVGGACGSKHAKGATPAGVFAGKFGTKAKFVSHFWVAACVKNGRLFPLTASAAETGARASDFNPIWSGSIPNLLASRLRAAEARHIPGFSTLRLCASGFSLEENSVVRSLALWAGARDFTQTFKRENTQLILCEATPAPAPKEGVKSGKRDQALKWEIPVVSLNWLIDCVARREFLASEGYLVFPEIQSTKKTKGGAPLREQPAAEGGISDHATTAGKGTKKQSHPQPPHEQLEDNEGRIEDAAETAFGGGDDEDGDFGFGKALKKAVAHSAKTGDGIPIAQPAPAKPTRAKATAAGSQPPGATGAAAPTSAAIRSAKLKAALDTPVPGSLFSSVQLPASKPLSAKATFQAQLRARTQHAGQFADEEDAAEGAVFDEEEADDEVEYRGVVAGPDGEMEDNAGAAAEAPASPAIVIPDDDDDEEVAGSRSGGSVASGNDQAEAKQDEEEEEEEEAEYKFEKLRTPEFKSKRGRLSAVKEAVTPVSDVSEAPPKAASNKKAFKKAHIKSAAAQGPAGIASPSPQKSAVVPAKPASALRSRRSTVPSSSLAGLPSPTPPAAAATAPTPAPSAATTRRRLAMEATESEEAAEKEDEEGEDDNEEDEWAPGSHEAASKRSTPARGAKRSAQTKRRSRVVTSIDEVEAEEDDLFATEEQERITKEKSAALKEETQKKKTAKQEAEGGQETEGETATDEHHQRATPRSKRRKTISTPAVISPPQALPVSIAALETASAESRVAEGEKAAVRAAAETPVARRGRGAKNAPLDSGAESAGETPATRRRGGRRAAADNAVQVEKIEEDTKIATKSKTEAETKESEKEAEPEEDDKPAPSEEDDEYVPSKAKGKKGGKAALAGKRGAQAVVAKADTPAPPEAALPAETAPPAKGRGRGKTTTQPSEAEEATRNPEPKQEKAAASDDPSVTAVAASSKHLAVPYTPPPRSSRVEVTSTSLTPSLLSGSAKTNRCAAGTLTPASIKAKRGKSPLPLRSDSLGGGVDESADARPRPRAAIIAMRGKKKKIDEQMNQVASQIEDPFAEAGENSEVYRQDNDIEAEVEQQHHDKGGDEQIEEVEAAAEAVPKKIAETPLTETPSARRPRACPFCGCDSGTWKCYRKRTQAEARCRRGAAASTTADNSRTTRRKERRENRRFRDDI